jgi:hypothetical protein
MFRLHRGTGSFLLTLFAATIVQLVMVRQACAADRDQLRQLLEDYRNYGLPLPPDDADLVKREHSQGTVNNVPQYSYDVVLCATINDKEIHWVGCQPEKPSGKTKEVLSKPTAAALQGTHAASLRSWDAGFATEADLALAIHCQSRGWEELAAALVERSRMPVRYDPFARRPPRPRDDRAALAQLAWNYWCNEWCLRPGDRSEVVALLKKLAETPFGLDSQANRNLIGDMEQTLAKRESTPGSLEAAVDSLIDLGSERRGNESGIVDLGYAVAIHKGHKQLRDAGLEAVPVLLKHLDDFRMTRCLGNSSRGAWHVRIADVVSDILNGLVAEEFSYDFLIEQGRGKRLDRDHVLHWWSSLQGTSALDYLRSHAIEEDADGKLQANEAILHALAHQFPDELAKLFEAKYETVAWSRPLFDSLGRSKVSPDTKTRLFLAAAKSRDLEKRENAIDQLLRLRHPDAVPLLEKELDALPKTPAKPYWKCEAQGLAQLAAGAHQDEIWKALEKTAKRVDVGQRLEIIKSAANCGDGERAIGFLSAFLADKEIRVIGDRFPDLSKAENPAAAFEKFTESLYSGPCAGFIWERLAVRDFAALQIAYALKLDVDDSSAWKDAEWSKLREQVHRALEARSAKGKAEGSK